MAEFQACVAVLLCHEGSRDTGLVCASESSRKPSVQPAINKSRHISRYVGAGTAQDKSAYTKVQLQDN